MVMPIISTQWKWYRYVLFVVVLSILAFFAYAICQVSLRSTHFLTGWILLLTILFLTIYNIRKKLPVLPLGPVSTWLRLHISMSWFSIILFPLHTEFRIPQGSLDVTLTLIFLTLIISGVLGLLTNKIFPIQLTTQGESILFERIPMLRRQLREKAESLIIRSVSETNSKMVVDYYKTWLRSFFEKPRNFLMHIVFSHRPLRKMMERNEFMDRYANPIESEVLKEIADCIRDKNHLDRQYALQSVLKGWFFAHVAITYSMLIFVALHALLAYSFYGGF